MTSSLSGNDVLDTLLLRLPAGLQEHVYRTKEKALVLSDIHGVDSSKAGLAAIAHDIVRAVKGSELLEKAKHYELTLHHVEKSVTVLLHGPVGAELLRRECGIEDVEILEAVRWHSTFNWGLGPVAKIAFLADKLDPSKAARYPFLDRIDCLAKENLDAAILAFLQEELASMVSTGKLIHPASVEGRNELLESQLHG